MRALFLGNHAVGVTVMDTLAELGVLAGVVAHPPDPEDGVRYLSVYDRAAFLGMPRLRAAGRDPALLDFVAPLAPDVLVVADYRYLLPTEILALAPHGAINFHPSLLPAYRGRAPINWAILHGETDLGLTMHVIDEGMDTGDVVAQRRYTLNDKEDVNDALHKLYPLYRELTRELISALTNGGPPRIPQDHTKATKFPRRRPEDGSIDFSAPARDVFNLVRAVARPYPGAFAWCGPVRITLWKAHLTLSFTVQDSRQETPPGTITHTATGRFTVACGTGALEVLDWEADRPGWSPKLGQTFDTVPRNAKLGRENA